MDDDEFLGRADTGGEGARVFMMAGSRHRWGRKKGQVRAGY